MTAPARFLYTVEGSVHARMVDAIAFVAPADNGGEPWSER